MNEFEEKLREQYRVKELLDLQITSLEDGHKAVDEISKSLSATMESMRGSDLDNQMFNSYTNVRYDLNTARKNVRNQMAKIVRYRK